MTARSLAIASIALAIGTASPGAAGTKVISEPFPVQASADWPAPAEGLNGLGASWTSKAAADRTTNTEPADPGIGGLQNAAQANPQQSGFLRFLSAILELAPAASH